jgi:hypothetical protein
MVGYVAAALFAGCTPAQFAAAKADEAKAKVILQDIAADAGPVGICAVHTVLAIATAISTGNLAALAGLEPCIANAVSLIWEQVKAGRATAPPLQNMKTVQTLHVVTKAATAAAAPKPQ